MTIASAIIVQIHFQCKRQDKCILQKCFFWHGAALIMMSASSVHQVISGRSHDHGADVIVIECHFASRDPPLLA